MHTKCSTECLIKFLQVEQCGVSATSWVFHNLEKVQFFMILLYFLLMMSKFMLERVYLARIRCFSSSGSRSSTQKSLDTSSFTIKYLINSCGFTQEKAISASRYFKFETANKPNLVLAFLRDHGLTQIQISKVVNSFPALLACNPEKIFSPKIEFLKSKGISSLEIVSLIYKSPKILALSLEGSLIPAFDFFTNFIRSEEKASAAFKRFLMFPMSDLGMSMKQNFEMLKQAGVPDKNIKDFVTRRSTALLTSSDRCRQVLEEIKKLGFNPLEMSFLVAFEVLNSLSKETWERKIEVYKQWGWSEDDILLAFRKSPRCMTHSEGKITLIMDFMVNKMGVQSLTLAQRAVVFSFSLEKRIIPRCIIYQALVSKSLTKPGDTCLITMIKHSKKHFLERIIGRHEDDASDLLKLYKQKLDLAK